MTRNHSLPKPGEPITRVVTRCGEVRYRTVLDYAPSGHPRAQRRRTFRTLTEARAHVAQVKADRQRGALPLGNVSFDEVADAWIRERERKGCRATTIRGYRDSLKHAQRTFGGRPIEKITRVDIEALAKRLQERGLSARTVNLCLGLVRSVFERALAEGYVVRNVAQSVTAHKDSRNSRIPLTLEEGRLVAATARNHRLAPAWLLTLSGLRRSEVLGLRWADIDFRHGTISICRSRVMIGSATFIGDSKTERGTRTLPVPTDVLNALKDWRKKVATKLGVPAISDECYVFVDKVGVPLRPEFYSDEWVRLCRNAGVDRRVRLHEARHYSVVMMRAAGLPDRLVAAWHGHDEVTMRRTYDHPDKDFEGLAEIGRALEALRSNQQTG